MIVLIAQLNVAEGNGNDVIEAFSKVVPLIRQDPRTVAYNILQAADNPDKITVYEKYEDRETLQYHGQTEHFKEFGRSTRDLFAGRAEITLYEEIV
ncbi:MAG: antibiotic biosynthesis monooxygenase [Dehalococcoidales bacterium]|nr:MAG: antibiotic biosynthesis monooxygenase [Dehalococcoidales bacterium]